MKADLPDHRKFLRLIRLLGEPPPHALGYLLFMWRRGYQTGNPLLGDALDVEAAAMYGGEPGKFTAAAKSAGFIDDDKEGIFSIHDLWDHAPIWAKKRMSRNGFAPDGTQRYAGSLPSGKKNTDSLPKREKKPRKVAARKTNRRLEIGDKKEESTLSDDTSGGEAQPKPRNELFDAIIEVTGLNQATDGGLVGMVTAKLNALDPPFMPAEVHEFAKRFWELCTWAAKDGRARPTPNEVAKYGPQIRAKPAPKQTTHRNGTTADAELSPVQQYLANQAAAEEAKNG